MQRLTTVVETSVFVTRAARIMSDVERASLIDSVAATPDAGVIIPGSKGLRKMQIGLAGRGKRGGGRIIYWYHSPGYPAVLLWVFAKNEAVDLTKAQLKRLIDETDMLVDDFGGRR